MARKREKKPARVRRCLTVEQSLAVMGLVLTRRTSCSMRKAPSFSEGRGASGSSLNSPPGEVWMIVVVFGVSTMARVATTSP